MIVEKARQCGKVSQLVHVARNTSSVAESVVRFVMEEKKINSKFELSSINKKCQHFQAQMENVSWNLFELEDWTDEPEIFL